MHNFTPIPSLVGGMLIGLSASGIASGLAGLGELVGGGMARGTMIALAIPVVVTALFAYAAYQLTLWLSERGIAVAIA